MGQNANTVYIVRRGTLVMETIFESDDFYKIPITNKEKKGRRWELRKTTRQYAYKVRTLAAGSVFGHEEIMAAIGTRRCRVTADTHVILTYINDTEFNRPDLA